MKKIVIANLLFCLFFTIKFIAQNNTSLKGKIVDIDTEMPISRVLIIVKNSNITTQSVENGTFILDKIPTGNQLLIFSLDNYEKAIISVLVNNNGTTDIGTIYLQPQNIDLTQESSIISLTDDDLLNDGEGNSEYIAGLFQSSKDAFLRTAAYNFSQAWFKVRGYDSGKGIVSINGIEMNKLNNGKPQWSDWGGLNDAFRNQEFSNGLAPSENVFGNILGTTDFNTRASDFKKGGKISLSSTNKTYSGRLMATYASGLLPNNWSFVLSGSRRVAEEGYVNGTSYNAWSGFLAVEKKINNKNSINLTAFATPNRRGKSSPNTQEVFSLKGYRYNSYWGKQNERPRNSRIKEIQEPMIMLTHYFESEKAFVKSTLAYQFGHIGNSRLGYFNAPNPEPTYWKYLPSNYLRFQDNLDYANAYLAEQSFKKDGQINWNNLYQSNFNNGESLYYLYEDREDNRQISFNSVLNLSLSNNLKFNGGISFQNLTSDNYARMLDLLGGSGFVDLDQFTTGLAQQNDLNNPNRIIHPNDKFQYNYQLNASTSSAFTQLQNIGKKIDYFVAVQLKNTNYQRNGLYKNGSYAGSSFGKGEKQSFTNFSAKGGFTYKINGRNLVSVNSGFLNEAPDMNTTFSNSRVNNNIIPDLKREQIFTGDISYTYRSSTIQTRLTTYYTKFTNGIETSFFFAEGLLGNQADFVNEMITGVKKKHIGAELSSEIQITPTIKLLFIGALGQFTYSNNPHLYLQSESLQNENSDFGISYLKNYKISGTPQQAYSLGFEYRDPNYWWFQANGSLLANNYLDISPLLRTNNFYLDSDGIPFIDVETGVQVTQEQIRGLLQQEKFSNAFVIDLVGGKSWRIKNNYAGVFLGINNVLGELFKTGGFEQSRNANYQQLKEDSSLPNPIFSPKYWYASGATYYLNLYVRF